MLIYYEVKDRKPFVKAIEDFTGAKAVYKRMPTCAYEVDYFTVTREGNLEFDDMSDSEEIESLIDYLAEKGYTAKPQETAETADSQGKTDSKELTEKAETSPNEANTGLTISIPVERVNTDRLKTLLKTKGGLIKKALGINTTSFEVQTDRVDFAWFDKIPSPDEVKAYSHFISALCKMTVTQNRINSLEREITNEKYAFRCFLLRLGFIGKKYKAERKILLRNLTGSSAFRNGTGKEQADL